MTREIAIGFIVWLTVAQDRRVRSRLDDILKCFHITLRSALYRLASICRPLLLSWRSSRSATGVIAPSPLAKHHSGGHSHRK